MSFSNNFLPSSISKNTYFQSLTNSWYQNPHFCVWL